MAKYDKVIPPGQEGTIHMVIEGEKVHGHFEKSATVYTNDPEHPTMMISIAADIVPYISITPGGQVYLQGQYGETIHKQLILKSNEEDLDFQITKVESNLDDKITYSYKPTQTPGEWELDVWKNPKLPTMSTFGSMFVQTNSAKSPTKTIQVRVITKGAITIEPKAVNFGTVAFAESGEPAEPVTREVTVLKAKGEFAIEDISFSTDCFKAEVEPVQPGKRYNIKVTFLPPEKKTPHQTHVADMTVKTNDPLERELTVRLVARSR